MWAPFVLAGLGCGGPATVAEPPPRATANAPTAGPAPASAAALQAPPEGPAPPCPEDMELVDTSFCPEVERTCLKDEYTKSNRITICHKFKPEPARCTAKEERRRFCIDKYEYPNKLGARAPVMIDFYDAMALCDAKGKRLCWEGEWVAACEGPDKTPFPYGYVRDPQTCNIDNLWQPPSLENVYSKIPEISGPELLRLDQSVRSGEKPGCVSGFGVHDQTGNFDEWVMTETPRGKSGPAGLKGGAWGHVRNACRPITTSHTPDFTYYFVSTRCCRDPDGPAPAGAAPWRAPVLPPNTKPVELRSSGWTSAR